MATQQRVQRVRVVKQEAGDIIQQMKDPVLGL